ncbi:MAG TPA: hypothetical protein VHX20_09890 [Terracidiphilus sp.]|jgi:hypothetical protein|nr:hypothetical protein [Terracidiphilus sp.]
MAVTIGEIDVEVAPPPAQQPSAAPAQVTDQPDLRKTIELFKERARRLKAD